MTQEKLKSIIENAVKEREIDLENADREDYMKILRDAESGDDTVLFDLIADADGHPIRIQAFTDVKYKEKTYSIILNFDLELYGGIDELTEEILGEYKRAYDLQKNFTY